MTSSKRYRDAKSLLLDLGITEPSEIDVNVIAHYCGARVKYRTLIGCEASIIGVEDRAVISVDINTNVGRQRFSVGHELGHWMFDRDQGSISIECQPTDIGAQWSLGINREVRANAFSADLLLPPYLFSPLALNRQMTLESANELAKIFQTSLTATAIRLVQLGSFPAMLVCYSNKIRKWFVRGDDVPESFWPHEVLDLQSEASDVFAGENRGLPKPTEVPADIWFDQPDAENYYVYEQSARITEDSGLVMIWWKDESQIIDAMEE